MGTFERLGVKSQQRLSLTLDPGCDVSPFLESVSVTRESVRPKTPSSSRGSLSTNEHSAMIFALN